MNAPNLEGPPRSHLPSSTTSSTSSASISTGGGEGGGGEGGGGGGLRSSSSGNIDGGDDFKEGTGLALESVISRKSAAISLACSMESGGSEGESNMEGAKGGMDVVDGDTDD